MKNTMKYMLVGLVVVVVLAASLPASADSSAKGTIDIKYNTRARADSSGKPPKDVNDVYTLKMAIAEDNVDKIAFEGTIENRPSISGRFYGLAQKSFLDYDLALWVYPSKGARIAVGKLAGIVPIDAKNAYLFDQGTVSMSVNTVGRAKGFQSPFRGTAFGKPKGDQSALGGIVRQAKTYTGSKGKKLVVKKYDVMSFQSVVLGAGPAASYPEVTVNGTMTYDYDRDVWFFDEGFTMTSVVDGKPIVNRLTGNVLWTESPVQGSVRDGVYRFDVRFNEPAVKTDEAAVAEKPEDEEAFFQVDPTLIAVTGTMSYKDQMRGESPMSSAIVVDLKGNKLSRTDLTAFIKMFELVGLVPVNEE